MHVEFHKVIKLIKKIKRIKKNKLCEIYSGKFEIAVPLRV